MSNIHEIKQIKPNSSFKISKTLKKWLQAEQHKEGVQFYNEFVRGILMNYVHQGKYYDIEVRHSEIMKDWASPTCIQFSDNQVRKISEALDEIDRPLNCFVNRVLTDLWKKTLEKQELERGI